MNLKKLHKGLTLGALVVVAIGGLALAAGRSGGSSASVTPAVDDAGSGGDVISKIDGALGRPSLEAQTGATGKGGSDIKPAPAQREVASTTAAAPAPGTGNGTTDTSGTMSDRKIVQTASIRLQVKEVGGSFEEVGRVATSAGGFVASSNFSFQGEQQIASATIRVPAARYQEVLGQLRSLGAKVDSEGSNASDITEEYSDLQARLRNLEATEAQLLTFLTQARNVSEVLQVQDRLNSVRNEIERAKGRMNLLDKLSDLATITVHLRPVVGSTGTSDGGGLGTEVTRAWEDSLDFLGGIATTVVTAIVFVWWLPVVAIPAYVAWRRWLRSTSPQAQVVARD
ncbi:MAG TPA: DUF4349 domain-containing protein [Dehalococcoidia bacterium]|nr:DUF4349 domain-containing protein [Dehalococcoidia bacterium]